MNEPDYARRAAAALAQAPTPVAAAADDATARAHVAAMEAALRSTRATSRGPLTRWVALAAGVILIAAATLALRAGRTADARVTATASSVGTFWAPGLGAQQLTGGVALPQSSRVTTRSGGGAVLEFSTGTRVELAGDTELSLDGLGERQLLHVGGGRITAHVAPVPVGAAFVMQTRDAEVEVKGTRFTVEVVPLDARCALASVTRVTVDEGLVLVRFAGHEVALHAHERWPSECFAAAAPPPGESSGSSLAAQNDLFAQAVTLKRQGDGPGAISLFEHLMDAWPHGPLTESAEVERMKLLADVDLRRGADAARAYLARYPKGFARAEATELAQKVK